VLIQFIGYRWDKNSFVADVLSDIRNIFGACAGGSLGMRQHPISCLGWWKADFASALESGRRCNQAIGFRTVMPPLWETCVRLRFR